MKIGFDYINDLNLSPDESFDWEGKATSLYCIIAGNISSDLKVIKKTLGYLGKFYQGIFYIPGCLEFSDKHGIQSRINDLRTILKSIRNVVFLHNHVVIVDSIAIVGINGWAPEFLNYTTLDKFIADVGRNEDLAYLANSIQRLQLHIDVKKIVIVSSAIPRNELYFGELPDFVENTMPLATALQMDKEFKVSHWIFGTQTKLAELTIDNIHYMNNSYIKNTPYWPKRIEVTI